MFERSNELFGPKNYFISRSRKEENLLKFPKRVNFLIVEFFFFFTEPSAPPSRPAPPPHPHPPPL